MKGLKKSNLKSFLEALARKYRLYVPATVGNSSRFVTYDGETRLLLDKKTLLSPKEVFFPPMEKMYCFQTKGQQVSIDETAVDSTESILFAVRSCDCSGIQCLDKVFLTRGFEDQFYAARRNNSMIFSLACNKPGDTCFCQSMGGDPQKAEGADVQMYEDQENYYFVPVSEKGAAFMTEQANLFKEMTDFAPTPFEQPLKIDAEGVAEKAEKMFDDPLWTKVSRACIGCSTCAYLCPTCYCFDLTSKRHGECGIKYRTWDCCMFDDYSKMAGGHNPRPSQKERVRNRILDKLVYNKKRHGRGFCVGCGRCVAKCPVNIDIAAIIKKIKEAE